jgi:glucose/arabinose dehydrogenase
VTVFKLAMIAALTVLGLCACESESKLPVSAGEGRNPNLPPPTETLIPTVNIAIAKGWPDGGKPKPAAGLRVEALADKLDHPRWLYVLPNGDVLVAETNGPERPRDSAGLSGWIHKQVMSWAGAVTKSADRITLLRGIDGNGKAQLREGFSGRAAFPLRHGACGRYAVCRQQQCRDEIPL